MVRRVEEGMLWWGQKPSSFCHQVVPLRFGHCPAAPEAEWSHGGLTGWPLAVGGWGVFPSGR